MTNAQQVTAKVESSFLGLEIRIDDTRETAIESFEKLTEPQREQLARDAWVLGHDCIMNALTRAREARFEDVGKALIDDVDVQLRGHIERQEQVLQSTLERYFDSESGQLAERLRHFLADDGSIAHLLQRHLAPENSMLAESLAKHVGDQSPLFRRLSPTESTGLVQVLGAKLQEVLQAEHQSFANALDPLSENGAVARFIRRLREELKKADDDQSQQLKAALSALDANDPKSLLSQLKRETQESKETLLHAINPAAEGSPLGVLHRTLTELLREQAKSQAQALAESQRHQLTFQQDVIAAVHRIETRREERARGSKGGLVFEDDVVAFAQRSIGTHGYIIDNTGSTSGIRSNCKKGDAVVRFPPDHAFNGSAVVIEAKRDRSYTVPRALEELSLARANRGADVGIFVMARSHAPAGFPGFARYGSDVLVTWDDTDPASDPYLQGALMVGLALATRKRSGADDGDLQALVKIEQRIQREVERLEKIREASGRIRKQVAIIDEEVATGSKNLTRLVEDAKKTLAALNVELSEEEVERRSPIVVPTVMAANDDHEDDDLESLAAAGK